MRMLKHWVWVLAFIQSSMTYAENRFIQVQAFARNERSQIANDGMSIEFVRSDSVWGFANENAIRKLKNDGFKILSNLDQTVGRGGHEGDLNALNFPPSDRKYHTYEQVKDVLNQLAQKNPDLAQVQSIGKTIENRDILALHLNSTPESLTQSRSNKPGVIFMGNHHAREHLSVEVPLMLAEYLLLHRADPQIESLLNTRDIWILPMINPDGSEFDIEGEIYKYWRKNRRINADGSHGVDLNRNYGFKWGTGGSDSDTTSDIYMGASPFSEPETQAVRDFVTEHSNTTILLSFHSYSELILYPWGHSESPIENQRDFAVFKKMAETMSNWNHYTPEQNSDLYVTSGDTTDWAYGERGIFAFTFELSPGSLGEGGFYPGSQLIDQVFKSNLKPCLYLIDLASNPYQVLNPNPNLLQELNPNSIYSF